MRNGGPHPTTRSLPRVLAALALSLGLVACGSAIDLGRLTPPVEAASPAASAPVADRTQQDAVTQTIQRANEAQAKAFNSGDPTVMKGTATDPFYAQLLQTNRDLAASGVRSIEIASTEFRDVTVDGSSATATTLETWRSTYTDGSADLQTTRNDYTLVLESGAWRIQTDDQPNAVLQPGPQTEIDTGTPATAASRSSTSTNWSGYSATGGTFTSVTGTWTVPAVSRVTAGADATWVGIGGIDARDLIQAGTQATVSGGLVAYEAWIEMLPAASRPVSLSVNAGDSVTVTLTQTRAGAEQLWTIVLGNNSTGGRYSTTVSYASSTSSAEWVQEAPSVGRGTVPLDDFGTVMWSGATAVRDGQTLGLQALGADAITMVNGARHALATPSVFGADGQSFTVTRTTAPATSGGGAQRRRRG